MRLIDADAINPMRVPQSVKEMRAWLDSQPTVEAVPVIRCKDCKYWDGRVYYCEVIDDSRDWKADDYCSLAERKEE